VQCLSERCHLPSPRGTILPPRADVDDDEAGHDESQSGQTGGDDVRHLPPHVDEGSDLHPREADQREAEQRDRDADVGRDGRGRVEQRLEPGAATTEVEARVVRTCTAAPAEQPAPLR
jgi:hypothetical protein